MNIQNSTLPTHLAFIMDGNGRWAQQRNLPRTAGHQRGVNAAKIVIQSALKFHIKYITLYTFSTENFRRPQSEVSFLMTLFTKTVKKYSKIFIKHDIKFNTFGNLSKLPITLQNAIINLQKNTANCSSLTVNIAINYGAHEEIVQAVQKAIDNKENNVQWSTIQKYLYTHDIPDPDMIIRTSGECRLSNFLLLQAAYSELYFIKTYWPDVNEQTFVEILNEFSRRSRRMGGI